MNKILPTEIRNIYKGHPIALWGFVAFLALMTWRSIIHLIYQEYGLHQIANFIVIDWRSRSDANDISFLFSLGTGSVDIMHGLLDCNS